MQLYVKIFNLSIPAYGLLITTGVILANIIAFIVLKKSKQDTNDFIILEAYGLLGGFIGAKLLYLLVSADLIQWDKLKDIKYLNQLMQSGFVFYGGLIGGLVFVILAGKIHKIAIGEYVRNIIFLIPFIHSFGRVGCFMAGCCYGIPYDGPFAVVYPENSFAVSGIKLFPVQLVEASGLMIIAILLLIMRLKYKYYYTVELYLIIYGILRFCLEFLRYDSVRGKLVGLSTSQWISVLLIITALIMIARRKKTAV